MSKRHIRKSKFHVFYHFFRHLWKPWEKNFTDSSCSKHPKIINLNKNDTDFYFHTSFWCVREVSSRKKCENKKIPIIPPPHPPPTPLILLGQQGLRLRFAEILTCVPFVSLTIEIHKNNTDTFRVTNKQYYKTILF